MEAEVQYTKAFVVWFTGLPASGKTTLANLLFDDLQSRGVKAAKLDGDDLRAMFPGTGFSREERIHHVKRAGMMAAEMEARGIVVVASLISPYRESRDYVRSICKRFIEIYVKASVETCEQRDPKGLYMKARAGKIKNFTGIDDPYEPPDHPDLVVDTEKESVESSFEAVRTYFETIIRQ